MNIINWTKHDINIYNEDKEHVVTIPPSGYEARIETVSKKVDTLDNILLFQTKNVGAPYLIDNDNKRHQLPPADDHTLYIVSGVFRSNYDRFDFYQPGQLIRNDNGQPIGCIGLSR